MGPFGDKVRRIIRTQSQYSDSFSLYKKLLICASITSDKTSSHAWVRNLGTKDIRKQQIHVFERKVMRKIHGLIKIKKGVGE
jgi:hypothetical protein